MLAAHAISEAGRLDQRRRWLPALAAGDARGSVAFLDTDLDWDAPAVAARGESNGQGWTLTGIKHFVPWAHVADVMIVPAQTTKGLALFLLDAEAAAVGLTPVTGIDPGTRWCSLHLDGVSLPTEARLDAPGAPVLEGLLRRGAVGAAAEMLGAARRCLDLAVAYAKVREQFGQPIGAFQAIRHTCAEMLMEVENAHAAVYYAAWALDAGAEDAAVAASVTKAYVSEAARKVCGAAIQVHGGIGFTWEYDLHLYFKRAKALEPMYGDAEYHRELLVRRVAG
jgi:alkylation response protein AidB-like acyl-CoA dehydrogenase